MYRLLSTLREITPFSKCVGCEGIGSALTPAEVDAQTALLIPDWSVEQNHTRLKRSVTTRDFASALAYVNRIAEIAEVERHHPDLRIFSYNNVEIILWTHALGGITENDLIMAVKIDTLPIR